MLYDKKMEKTKELFDIWNENKKQIEFQNNKRRTARVGEFWRYREWINLGNEISKDWKFKRICLILHNNIWNWLFLVSPITTKYHKRMEKYYIKIENYEKYGLRECRIIKNQIKLIDNKRLFSKLNNERPLIWLAIKTRYWYRDIIKK